MFEKIRVFSISGMEEIKQNTVDATRVHLPTRWEVEPGSSTVNRFSNTEIEVQVDNVREQYIVVICTQAHPVNETVIELMWLLDAIVNSDPKDVLVVFPYMPYCRSDRKNQSRISVGGQIIPRIINRVSGVRKVLLIESHDPHIKQYFDPTANEIPAMPFLIRNVREALPDMNPENSIVVFPDAGAGKRYEKVPDFLGWPTAYVDKHLNGDVENPTAKAIVGDVNGKHCLILDDEVLTGKTVIADAGKLLEAGAESVRVAAVHGTLACKGMSSVQLFEMLSASPIEHFYFTTSVTQGVPADLDQVSASKFSFFKISDLIGQAVARYIQGEPLSELHKYA